MAAPARRPPPRPLLRRTIVPPFPPPLQRQTDCARRYSRNGYSGKPIFRDVIPAAVGTGGAVGPSGPDDGALPRVADIVEDRCATCASHPSMAASACRRRQAKQRPRNRFPAVLYARTAPPSAHEAKVGGRKLGEVRKYRAEIGGPDAEPACKSRSVLVHRSAWQPAAFGFGVARTAENELRVLTVHRAAVDRVADDEVVIAPCVIGAAAGRRLKGASEI